MNETQDGELPGNRIERMQVDDDEEDLMLYLKVEWMGSSTG